MRNFINIAAVFLVLALSQNTIKAQVSPQLLKRQQDFIDLRFGMFIHYNIPTYMEDDWADPDADPSIFNPKQIDFDQWAKAAKSANMTYGALTTKHHSGFSIWDTKTTEYSVMSSPYGKDVVKGYVDAFRKNDLKVMLYYSILDTHHKIRPGMITEDKIQFIKDQLTELLTNYGEIDAMIIDGWDAPWSRISYDDVPFEEIYNLIKSIQPDCLVMDLNAAKYPAEALFYTDIKSYEQNAGQHIEKDANILPALSCYPLQQNWFWKPWFPENPVKDPKQLVNENLIPFNEAYCNYILNVAPNRDGKIDDNAMKALKEIGKLWQHKGPMPALKGNYDAPIISSNIAKFKPSNSSWSNDMNIMDFANDDDFGTAWVSNKAVENAWWEVDLNEERSFNMIVITENNPNISSYTIKYFKNNQWHELLKGSKKDKIKIHRFERVYGEKVRINFDKADSPPVVLEVGVYNERR